MAINPNNQQQQEQPMILSAEQIIVKMIIDSQNNINKLIEGQERLIQIQQRQMVYIDSLMTKVNNESTTPTPISATTNNSEDKKENTEKSKSGKPVNTQPVS